MQIERKLISDLKRAKYNPRVTLKPTDPEYIRLDKAIDKFGMVEPVVWNKRSGNVVGGHQRLNILEARGETDTDVSVVDLSDRDERALNLALNKHAGKWDLERLGDLLGGLKAANFDMDLTGFGPDELDEMIMPAFAAGTAEGQGQLDRKEAIKCPHCGKEFTR